MIDASNMSNEEFYRLNGTLSPQRIETLLTMEQGLVDKDLAISLIEGAGEAIELGEPSNVALNKLRDALQYLYG